MCHVKKNIWWIKNKTILKKANQTAEYCAYKALAILMSALAQILAPPLTRRTQEEPVQTPTWPPSLKTSRMEELHKTTSMGDMNRTIPETGNLTGSDELIFFVNGRKVLINQIHTIFVFNLFRCIVAELSYWSCSNLSALLVLNIRFYYQVTSNMRKIVKPLLSSVSAKNLSQTSFVKVQKKIQVKTDGRQKRSFRWEISVTTCKLFCVETHKIAWSQIFITESFHKPINTPNKQNNQKFKWIQQTFYLN